MLDKAISYAARAHYGQMRKDRKTPYIAHPVRVMTIICRTFGVDDEKILAAAVMHDVIEDTTKDYENIAYHFGVDVAELVVAMSKDPRLPEKIREDEYHEQIARASWKARIIKLADCLDNLTDAVDEKMQRRASKKAERAISLVKMDDPSAVQEAAEILQDVLERVREKWDE